MSFHIRKHALHGTRIAALLLRQRISKLLGYPSRGLQADGSSHPRVVASWDGTGVAPVGWTRLHSRVRKHPTLSQWAVSADSDIQAALDRWGVERLNVTERTAIQAALTSAALLDASWDNSTEDDDI